MQQMPALKGGPLVASATGLRRCAGLDPRRRAAGDPGNAVPWFHLLKRADAANDSAGQREASQQLAAASRFHVGEASPCDASRKLRAHFVLVAKVGEVVAAAQEIAARSAR